MEWVRNFYEKQYAWANWKTRWADLDLDEPGVAAHVEALRRMAGSSEKRILELGCGVGTVAAALAHAGHSVVAVELIEELVQNTQRLAADVRAGCLQGIAGDFYEIELDGRFDVVAYFDGFGIGTDDDQRRLLLRISEWLTPEGCALIDVFSPWYWAIAGERGRVPGGRRRVMVAGIRSMPKEAGWSRRCGGGAHEDLVVVQSLRCLRARRCRAPVGRHRPRPGVGRTVRR